MVHFNVLRVAIVLALLLAGCTAPNAASPSASPDPKDDDSTTSNATTMAQFHDNYTVEVLAVENGSDPLGTANCLAVVSEEDQMVANISAVATWTSTAPTRYDLTYLEDSDTHETVTGSSPLEVRMEESRLLEGRALFRISVEPSVGNTAPQTSVNVELRFEHEAQYDVEIWYGSCDISPPPL